MTSTLNRHLVTVLLLLLLGSTLMQAQRPGRNANSLRVQYSLLELPGPGPDTSYVDLLFRIPGNQFVFLRNQASGQFIARGELFIELRHIDTETTVREFASIEITRSRQVRDQDDIPDYQGHIRLSVPSGEYRAIIEVKDTETGRSFLDRSRRYVFGPPEEHSGILRNPMLGYRNPDDDTFIPFNRGGAIRFGSRGGLVFSVRMLPLTGPVSVRWKLEQTSDESGYELNPIDSTMTIEPGNSILTTASSDPVVYRIERTDDDAWTSIFLEVPIERLEPGAYQIDVTLTSGEKTFSQSFSFPVIWEDRPMSMNRFDLAVDALRYIASEEDIDDMIGFMADGGRERFREFWQRKDPDPSTAYNEVMAEYYRRVDETIMRFSTRGELDGYRSDRGRIYILFGTPTSMDRIFRPETGPREVWVYTELKKRFIFTDPTRTGDYTLSQTEEL